MDLLICKIKKLTIKLPSSFKSSTLYNFTLAVTASVSSSDRTEAKWELCEPREFTNQGATIPQSSWDSHKSSKDQTSQYIRLYLKECYKWFKEERVTQMNPDVEGWKHSAVKQFYKHLNDPAWKWHGPFLLYLLEYSSSVMSTKDVPPAVRIPSC